MFTFEPAGAWSLYIHIPFCAHKCSYCAFYSEPPVAGEIDGFLDALCLELEGVPVNRPPETIFFGGGTPSILNVRQWTRIVSKLRDLDLTPVSEWTVECNPATVSEDKALAFVDFGVTRVSMGVQSLDEKLLEQLGRIHSRSSVFKSYDIFRRSGIQNINLDLMFGIPGQSLETWKNTVDEALDLQSEHLSCYEVIYEEDTPLFQSLQQGDFVIDEDLNGKMYHELLVRSNQRGYQQYEIANFARRTELDGPDLPAYSCRHNVNYWRGGDFLAVGPSGSGCIENRHYKNIGNTKVYIDRLLKGQSARDYEEALTPIQRAGEIAAFGLRMNAGWRFEQFRKRTGVDLEVEWGQEISKLEAEGHAIKSENDFKLTAEGIRFADAAASMFIR